MNIWSVIAIAGLASGLLAGFTSDKEDQKKFLLPLSYAGLLIFIVLGILAFEGRNHSENYAALFFFLVGFPIASASGAIFLVGGIRCVIAKRERMAYAFLTGLLALLIAVFFGIHFLR